MTTKFRSSRISPDDPDVFNACKAAVVLMLFYGANKHSYFNRFVKPNTKASFREFEAITSERYIFEGARATRGVQKGRTGVIQTIRFCLFRAIRDSLEEAKTQLKIEFDREKVQTYAGPTTEPRTARQQAREERKQKRLSKTEQAKQKQQAKQNENH